MRHLEAGLVHALVPVEEQVQVERAGAAGRPCPDAAELGFDREQHVEQAARRQRRLDRDGAVEEPRLVGDWPDRIGLTEGRHRHYFDARRRCQTLDGNT
jgi:hypothetical protein